MEGRLFILGGKLYIIYWTLRSYLKVFGSFLEERNHICYLLYKKKFLYSQFIHIRIWTGWEPVNIKGMVLRTQKWTDNETICNSWSMVPLET